MGVFERLKEGTDLRIILEATIGVWPNHGAFLDKSFKDRSDEQLRDSNFLAEIIGKIAGENLTGYCEAYRWTCERLTEEELYFRRSGGYRFKSQEEVSAFISKEPDYMNKYIKGLLLSQLFWNNHVSTFGLLRNRFLPANPFGYRHLEIGPGHGLLLYLAASDSRCAYCEAWEVNRASLDETSRCLEIMGVRGRVKLVLKDGNASDEDDGARFDSIVMSEVLEHVEQPRELLRKAADRLAKDGRIFINMPVNSPAPDHIFLMRSLEDVVGMITSSGLQVRECSAVPMTGFTYERAIKMSATISCVVVASL